MGGRRGLEPRGLGADRVHQLLADPGADDLGRRVEAHVPPRCNDPGREIALLRDERRERRAALPQGLLRHAAQHRQAGIDRAERLLVGLEIDVASDEHVAAFAGLEILHRREQPLERGDLQGSGGDGRAARLAADIVPAAGDQGDEQQPEGDGRAEKPGKGPCAAPVGPTQERDRPRALHAATAPNP